MHTLTERALAVLDAITPEQRPSQQQMVRALAWAFDSAEWVQVEAPTGVGKSYANLIVAALAPDPVVISTGTKALQTQYERQDVPTVQRALRNLGVYADFAILKGRTNYGCKAAANSVATDGLPADAGGHPEGLVEAARWVMTTDSDGDWSNAPVTITQAEQRRLSVDGDACLSQRCPFYGDCHAERARARAREAKVVVVNHALLAVDVAAEGRVLPPVGGYIVDEWHDLERAAEGVFGTEITFRAAGRDELYGTLPAIGSRLVGLAGRSNAATTIAADLKRAAVDLYDEIGRRFARERPGTREVVLDAVDVATRMRMPLAAASVALEAADELLLDVEPDENAPASRQVSWRQARAMVRNAVEVVTHAEAGEGFDGATVQYLTRDRDGRNVSLRSTTVDVGPLFRTFAWEDITRGVRRPVAAVSATIPDRYGARLGLDAPVVQLPPSLPNRERCIVHCADDLPSAAFRTRGEWEPLAVERAKLFADAALRGGGGVLVLCASHAQVRTFAEALRPLAIAHPGTALIVDDGDQDVSRDDLMRRLRNVERPLAVGTLAAWGVGLDLPGKLRLVILPSVPFPPPGSPVADARKQLAPSSEIPHPLDVATAAATWGQAAGRLMRRRTDWGVVLCLDPRLMRGGSAPDLRAKLPAEAHVLGAQYGGGVLQWLADGGPDALTGAA